MPAHDTGKLDYSRKHMGKIISQNKENYFSVVSNTLVILLTSNICKELNLTLFIYKLNIYIIKCPTFQTNVPLYSIIMKWFDVFNCI